MITITTQPDSNYIYPAYNFLVYKGISTNYTTQYFKYACDIFINNVFISRHKFLPLNDGTFKFDISRVIQDYLSYSLTVGLSEIKSPDVNTLNIKVKTDWYEEINGILTTSSKKSSDNCIVFNGGLSNRDNLYIDDNFYNIYLPKYNDERYWLSHNSLSNDIYFNSDEQGTIIQDSFDNDIFNSAKYIKYTTYDIDSVVSSYTFDISTFSPYYLEDYDKLTNPVKNQRNPDFTTSLSGWTIQSFAWYWSTSPTGSARKTSSTSKLLSQNCLTVGRNYRVDIHIPAYTSGDLIVGCGGNIQYITSGVGYYSLYFKNAITTTLALFGSFVGYLNYVRVYRLLGETQESDTEDKFKVFPVGPKNINNMTTNLLGHTIIDNNDDSDPNKTTKSYTIDILNVNYENVYKQYTFNLQTCIKKYERIILAFQNKLGAISYLPFVLNHKKTFNMERGKFEKFIDYDYNLLTRGRTQFSNKVYVDYDLLSDHYNQEQCDLYEQLLYSPEVFMFFYRNNSDEPEVYPVNLTETEKQSQNIRRDGLVQYGLKVIRSVNENTIR